MVGRSSRRNYNRISANQDNDTLSSSGVNGSNALDEPLSSSSSSSSFENEEANENDDGSPIKSGTTAATTNDSNSPSSPSLNNIPPIYNEINVILMDAAQSKFNIACDPKWNISQFKQVSASITKVPPQSQRLIHMGKLLQDRSTLEECGIEESDKIIHLFPKPNVVITNNDEANNQTAEDGGNNDADDDNNANNNGGAHVPQIILDAEEANRRSQILILSSQEIFEAQHRVKIFSFLLMIICAMELLTLVTLFVGMAAEDPTGYGPGSNNNNAGPPPGNPTDAPPSGGSANAQMQMRTWQNSDYFDAIISAFGFYVSLLGIKATTENTLQLAKQYFVCLVVAAIGFNSYYFYTGVQAEEKNAEQRNRTMDDSELYTSAFVGILLPLTIWLLCVIRAYQFHQLIREAEIEAEERTRGLDGEGAGGNGNNNISGNGEESETSRSLPYGSNDDLELTVDLPNLA